MNAALSQQDLDRHIAALPQEPTEENVTLFLGLVRQQLEPWQAEQAAVPKTVRKRQTRVLATHWHPEFVPLDLIRARLAAMFPHCEESLIIPTQHNELLEYDGRIGVEVDCREPAFSQKVQLLLHFSADRAREAPVLRSMLAHTFQYRSSQFFEFLHALTKPDETLLRRAARSTGADEPLTRLVRHYARLLEQLVDAHWADIPPSAVKNKLLRDFLDGQRPHWPAAVVNAAQAFLKGVKEEVKNRFSLDYFYTAQEVLEETRGLGGRAVIPHPEQFWPVLLADYDVDGYEVWNPQSQRYTKFLIEVIRRKNAEPRYRDRPLLVFMGDDCHMGEKTRPQELQDPLKASREIGYQPAWDQLGVRKVLNLMGVNRLSVIREYKARLEG